MSKDKKKKKFFQGMEHLQATVTPELNATEKQPVDLSESYFIKKDFKQLGIIFFVFLLIMIGLFIVNLKSDFFEVIARNVTSLFITF